MSKLALFLALSSIIFLSGCRVSKNISKQETQKEEASKVYSSATVKNDIKKETKTISETTEIIDTVIQVTPKGDIVADTTQHKGKTISVNVKKKRLIKIASEVLETDQSKVKVEVKKKEEKKEETSEKGKVIEKTGFTLPWYWCIILLVLVAGYLAWRFYFRRL